MARIGARLIKESKASQESSKSSSKHKDILSLLVQANIRQDLPEVQRLKDEDVVARAYKSI